MGDEGISAEVRRQFVERGMAALDGLVPPETREEAVQRILSAAISVSVNQTSVEAQFRGTIPPPAMIAHYERIHPGLADRLMRMAGTAQQAEIDSANDVNRRTDRYQLLSLAAGFVGLVIIVIGAAFLALHDQKGGRTRHPRDRSRRHHRHTGERTARKKAAP